MTKPSIKRMRGLYAYDRNRGVLISRKLDRNVGYIHNGYSQIAVGRKKIKVHHIIWLFETGCWPTRFIDHIDGNRLNNLFSNLREATVAQNTANSVVRSDNKLRIKGVREVKKKNVRYRAQIRSNGKQIHLGFFDTAHEAHAAYCDAAIHYHGKFFCSGKRGPDRAADEAHTAARPFASRGGAR